MMRTSAEFVGNVSVPWQLRMQNVIRVQCDAVMSHAIIVPSACYANYQGVLLHGHRK